LIAALGVAQFSSGRLASDASTKQPLSQKLQGCSKRVCKHAV
jgi:hypothetical protein